MAVRQRQYDKSEFVRRGTELYEVRIRPQVESGNEGRIVAVDIDTGEYELADDVIAASDRLLVRCPDAQIWFVRIGHRGIHQLGSLARGVGA